MRHALPIVLAAVLAGCASSPTAIDHTYNLEGADVSTRELDGDLFVDYRVQGQLHVF